MEIVGGFMVMMSILGLFLAVVWLVMPFVVFAIKGKQDRTLELLEQLDKRLMTIEATLHSRPIERLQAADAGIYGRATDEGASAHSNGDSAQTVHPVSRNDSPELLAEVQINGG